MTRSCVTCGADVREGAKFCAGCGTPTGATAYEREIEAENNL